MTDYVGYASNPMAPDAHVVSDDAKNHKLSNSDFRRLLMTPRPSSSATAHDDARTPSADTAKPPTDRAERKSARDAAQTGSTNRSKHKRYHTRHHKRDGAKETESEAQQRYRDRAKERRDGKLIAPVGDAEDKEFENDDEALTRTADYRAVAPSTAAGESLAERRRMIIQESKYLGGDMEHTHLVKGLDYVLLQKVRLEIQNKELEAEKALDFELSKPEVPKEQAVATEDGMQFRTRLGASIYDVLFNNRAPVRNEYFQPGRMAYRIELEDDSVDFEVPATVIRSKSDCYQIDGRESTAITTNEIVINKLTQILSYLRAGKRQAKKAKLKGRFGEKVDSSVDSGKQRATRIPEPDIFEGVGTDYVPSKGAIKSGNRTANQKTGSTETSSTHAKAPIFDSSKDAGATSDGQSLSATKEFVQQLSNRFGPKDDEKGQDKASLERFFAKTKVTCYDECYPGFLESYDAMGDSDDEADFSKMDLGNKKGPVGRWDFETQEEYSDYMSSKEALPKAAFQYGVKMADGRRTRRLGPKDDKAEFDRQLQKIQSIIQKRKQLAEEVEPIAKNPRY